MSKITRVWNAHTPKFLHPYTKENLIFQIALASVLIGGMMLWDHLEERQNRRERENNVIDLQEHAGQR